MNLYLLSQSVNSDVYTYDAAVVAAENEEEAKLIKPYGEIKNQKSWMKKSWADAKDIKIEYLGKAKDNTKSGIILASFNDG